MALTPWSPRPLVTAHRPVLVQPQALVHGCSPDLVSSAPCGSLRQPPVFSMCLLKTPDPWRWPFQAPLASPACSLPAPSGPPSHPHVRPARPRLQVRPPRVLTLQAWTAGVRGLQPQALVSWWTWRRMTGPCLLLVPNTVVNGRVHIRDWREKKLQRQPHSEAKRRLCSEAFKTRMCWFYSHHPDGCVLPSDSCPFAHGPAELRPPQTPKRKKPVL